MELFGKDMFGNEIKPQTGSVLVDEFIEPPFSVLNANGKRWNARKRAWINQGIQSELGRDICRTRLISACEYVPDRFRKTTASVFDPVLCEIMYTWFCPEGGQILDPFAGGSVRGIVAHKLDRQYYGIELRAEQVAANREQSTEPTWIEGDSLDKLPDAPEADFLFTCPPYGNLERYSDDPRDISNMSYEDFIDTYRNIILLSIEKLIGEYAVFVVGNFRDKDGYYHHLVGDTVSAFEQGGMRLYNDIILLTPTGTAAMISRGHFNKSKKVTKTHQNVLVFKH